MVLVLVLSSMVGSPASVKVKATGEVLKARMLLLAAVGYGGSMSLILVFAYCP